MQTIFTFWKTLVQLAMRAAGNQQVPAFYGIFIESNYVFHIRLNWIDSATILMTSIVLFLDISHRPLLVQKPTVSRSDLCLAWWRAPIWSLWPDFYYCQTVAGLLMWGTLWRENVSAFYDCCWFSPAQSFLAPSPAGLVTIFYWLRFETPRSGGRDPHV
jgi:hypothetical protein